MKINFPSLASVIKGMGLSRAVVTQSTQVYSGMVAGYPASVALTVTDNLAYGTLVYTRSGIPIRVVGTLNGSQLTMHEFDNKGHVMGIYVGNRSAETYAGTWRSPSTSHKVMPFSFSALTMATKQAPVQLTDLTGTYRYKLGVNEASATLLVQQVDPNKVVVSMQGVSSESAQNQCVVSRKTVDIAANQALVHTTEFGDCTLKLTFFNGGACVDYVDTKWHSRVGKVAAVTGNYMRTDSRTPIFPAA